MVGEVFWSLTFLPPDAFETSPLANLPRIGECGPPDWNLIKAVMSCLPCSQTHTFVMASPS